MVAGLSSGSGKLKTVYATDYRWKKWRHGWNGNLSEFKYPDWARAGAMQPCGKAGRWALKVNG